jgi:hypothetical protein
MDYLDIIRHIKNSETGFKPTENTFTVGESIQLTEIYRRLNFLHSGDLNNPLAFLAYPSEAKKIMKYGLVKPYSTETQRVANWYSLTEKGKKFFQNYLIKNLNNFQKEKINTALFEGKLRLFFDKNLLN